MVGMHPSSENLDAFARGEIDEADASAIEDHLATCTACQAARSRWARARSLDPPDPCCRKATGDGDGQSASGAAGSALRPRVAGADRPRRHGRRIHGPPAGAGTARRAQADCAGIDADPKELAGSEPRPKPRRGERMPTSYGFLMSASRTGYPTSRWSWWNGTVSPTGWRADRSVLRTPGQFEDALTNLELARCA